MKWWMTCQSWRHPGELSHFIVTPLFPIPPLLLDSGKLYSYENTWNCAEFVQILFMNEQKLVQNQWTVPVRAEAEFLIVINDQSQYSSRRVMLQYIGGGIFKRYDWQKSVVFGEFFYSTVAPVYRFRGCAMRFPLLSGVLFTSWRLVAEENSNTLMIIYLIINPGQRWW